MPVLDIHEIVAGKMVALVTRRAARDLFDAHRIIAMPGLDWLTARPVAHRGLHDVGNGVIENTTSAFQAAISGNYAIECDLQTSADGEAMETGR